MIDYNCNNIVIDDLNKTNLSFKLPQTVCNKQKVNCTRIRPRFVTNQQILQNNLTQLEEQVSFKPIINWVNTTNLDLEGSDLKNKNKNNTDLTGVN